MGESLEAVPTHPSNRQFIAQLKLWQCREGKTKGEHVEMIFPDGSTLAVLRPHIHDGNPSSVFTEAFKRLGVSNVGFWRLDRNAAFDVRALHAKGNSDADELLTPDPPTPQQRGTANKVLDLLTGQGPMSTAKIAQISGIDRDQANSACAYLHRKGCVDRVKHGVYRSTIDRQADAKVDIDIDVNHDHGAKRTLSVVREDPEPEPAAATPPEPEPEPVAAAPALPPPPEPAAEQPSMRIMPAVHGAYADKAVEDILNFYGDRTVIHHDEKQTILMDSDNSLWLVRRQRYVAQ